MKKMLFPLSVLIALTGCGNSSAPDCSSTESTNLVIEIATESISESLNKAKFQMKSLAKAYGMVFKDELFNDIELSVNNIRTVKIDEKLGSFECEANLTSTLGEDSENVSISYTSELANGGKDFYVQVYGLTEEEQGSLISVLMKKE